MLQRRLFVFAEDIPRAWHRLYMQENREEAQFDFGGILSRLLYTRLLYPGSKLSSLEESKRFIEQPEEDIHQVYRALSLLATEFNEIQAECLQAQSRNLF